MAINNDPLKKAFNTIKTVEQPSTQQKNKMLDNILLESRQQNSTLWAKFRNFIFVYPWRFAFGLSTAQAVVCTLLFGTKYTNIFLSFFGG